MLFENLCSARWMMSPSPPTGNFLASHMLVYMCCAFRLCGNMLPCNKKQKYFIIDREAREIMHLVVSVRPFVCALMVEPFDLRPSSFAWRSTLTLARLTM